MIPALHLYELVSMHKKVFEIYCCVEEIKKDKKKIIKDRRWKMIKDIKAKR